MKKEMLMSLEFSIETVAQGNSDLPPTLLRVAAIIKHKHSLHYVAALLRVHLIGILWCEKPTPPTLVYALTKGPTAFTSVS